MLYGKLNGDNSWPMAILYAMMCDDVQVKNAGPHEWKMYAKASASVPIRKLWLQPNEKFSFNSGTSLVANDTSLRTFD